MTNSGTATLTLGYANIQTNGGTGINASGGGTLNITDGSSIVNSTGGKALDLDGQALGVTLASIISSGSSSSGIELDNISGMLTINGGNIMSASGTAYDVGGTSNNSGGNATVVYAGTINNTAGRAVLIQELNGGSHTLSGNITHNASAEGIQVSEINNGPSASVTFSGTTKIINSGTSHAVDLNTNTNGTINFTNGGLDLDVSTGTGFNATMAGTINVSGGGNTINTTAAGRSIVLDAVVIGGSNITFSSISASGTGVNAPTTTPVFSQNVTGGTFNGGNVDVDDTGGTADGISIVSSSATFNFTSAAIDNTGDAGINLAGANGTVTFSTVDIDGTSGNGIDISANTMPININGGSIGSTMQANLDGVDIKSAQGNIAIATSVTNTSNRSIEVTNSGGPGGNLIDFGGAISDSGIGIRLDNNDQSGGATISFKGGLNLNTGSNTAFMATNGGTVNVCEDNNCSAAGGTAVVNTIGAATALSTTAVNITATSIGSENVIFQSIRASGSTNGIILNNTGTQGGLVVTGVNGPCGNTAMAKDCDGGYIRNSTGDAVQLTNTSKFSLSNFEISGSAINGINGVSVTDFSLINCEVLNNGDAVNEGGLRFDQNLLGTSNINGTLISGSAEHNVEIINNSGNLTQLNINNSRIGSNSMTLGADGLLLELMSSATANVVVTNSVFDDNKSDGIQISTLGTSNASISVTGSTFNLGARGINLSNGNSSELTFDIGGNMMSMGNNFSNFSPALGEEAINLAIASTSTTAADLEGSIKFNTFTSSGGAIGVDTRGDGIATFDFSNNTAVIGMNRQVIDIITGDVMGDAPTLNLTMLNNNLGPTSLVVDVVSIEFTRDSKACLNVRDNTFTRTGTGDGIDILDDTNTGPTNPEIKLEQNSDCGGSPCATAELQIEATNTILPTVKSTVDNMTLVAPGTCPTPMFP